MSKNALGICYETSTIFRIREFVAKFWTVQIFWSEFPIRLRIARTDYGLYELVKIFANWVRSSHESKYLSIRGDSCPVWNRGFAHILTWNWQEPFLNQRKVANKRISVFMTNLQEIMAFGWVETWLTAGLASDITLIWILPIAWRCTTGLISVVDANIAPMNPYQPLPVQSQW